MYLVLHAFEVLDWQELGGKRWELSPLLTVLGSHTAREIPLLDQKAVVASVDEVRFQTGLFDCVCLGQKMNYLHCN